MNFLSRQEIVDKVGQPLDVVGSSTKPIQRIPASDIDYTTSGFSKEYFDKSGLSSELPGIDPKHGILQGAPENGSIRFEPGQPPTVIKPK